MKTNQFYSNYFKTYQKSTFQNKARRSQNYALENEFLINRMPIMTCLAYCIAKRNGDNEDLAKSKAIAVATGYAILKKVGLRYGSTKKIGGTFEDIYFEKIGEPLKAKNIINFCGISMAIENNQVIGLVNVRGKQNNYGIYQFNNQMQKINVIKSNGFNWLCQKINENLDNEQIKDFSNEIFGKHFFNFWKKYRDYWRTKEFWQK